MAEYQIGTMSQKDRLILSTLSLFLFSYLISDNWTGKIFFIHLAITIILAKDYFYSKGYLTLTKDLNLAIFPPFLVVMPLLFTRVDNFLTAFNLALLTIIIYLEFARQRIAFYLRNFKKLPKELNNFSIKHIVLIEGTFIILEVVLFLI